MPCMAEVSSLVTFPGHVSNALYLDRLIHAVLLQLCLIVIARTISGHPSGLAQFANPERLGTMSHTWSISPSRHAQILRHNP